MQYVCVCELKNLFYLNVPLEVHLDFSFIPAVF